MYKQKPDRTVIRPYRMAVVVDRNFQLIFLIMRNLYKTTFGNQFSRIILFVGVMLTITGSVAFYSSPVSAQIWEPEGINMPGAWNGWLNPPTNNLALASSTQVPGGEITKITTGTPRYQTTFGVAASGGDIVGGTYNWLFTSGPTATPWQNKWAGVVVVMNTLQSYQYNTGPDNTITIENGFWYTVVWEDAGYNPNRAIFMRTSAEPVLITAVSSPGSQAANQPVQITITTNLPKSPEELLFLRYTTNNWATSFLVPVTITGTSGSATIPGYQAGLTVAYNVFSTTVTGLTADYDLYTIRFNNNNGANFSYSITGTPPAPEITFANLQWPPTATILVGGQLDVFAQVLAIGVELTSTGYTGMQVWVGFHTSNNNPAGWTNWIPATYIGISTITSRPEYKATIGSTLAPGIYFYATRFQLPGQGFIYGGYSATGGGFWDGNANVSGALTVNPLPPDPEIGWANLQWPPDGSIQTGEVFNVYAQVFADGFTNLVGQGPGIEAWIGYSTSNTNPNTWTTWIPATFANDVGNNDEYIAEIGTLITTPGTYYYASRFQLSDQSYVYGGYSTGGGGFWDGTSNISGVLTVTQPPSSFPVNFTIVDATQSHQNVKITGSMNAWQPVPMTQYPPHTWTITYNLEPGTYHWGAIEDTGTPPGLWLIGVADTLTFTLDNLGNITGDTSYTTTITPVIERDHSKFLIYPNPVRDWVVIEAKMPGNLTVTNLAGVTIITSQITAQRHLLDLSKLPSGVYLLRLETTNHIEARKILKQ